MIEIFLYSVLIMLASLVGKLSVWNTAGRIIERNLDLLVSFSAGVYVVIAYQLGQEAIEHSGSISLGIIWMLVGASALWLLFKFLPFSHHHHDPLHEVHEHSRLDVRRILTSDFLHNIGDGVILAASFAVSSSLALFAALSIFVHELVQEMSQFFVLRQAGYSTRKSLILNFTISSSILIGSIGGFFLLESFEAFEAPLLGITTGAFLVVVLHDLIPHSIRSSHQTKLYGRYLLWFFLGACLMFVISTLLAHS